MARPSPDATRQDRRHLPRLRRDDRPHPVHSLVQQAEPARRHGALHHAGRNPRLQELPAGHDPVLCPGRALAPGQGPATSVTEGTDPGRLAAVVSSSAPRP
jgi:hypothetical protein